MKKNTSICTKKQMFLKKTYVVRLHQPKQRSRAGREGASENYSSHFNTEKVYVNGSFLLTQLPKAFDELPHIGSVAHCSSDKICSDENIFYNSITDVQRVIPDV